MSNLYPTRKKWLQHIVFSAFFAFSALTSGSALVAADLTNETSSQEQADPIQWIDGYDKGIEKGKKTGLPIFVSFTGPDWCHFCKLMDEEIFASDLFGSLVKDKFVFVRVLLPKNGAYTPEVKSLIDKYDVRGIPTVVILSSDGSKEITRLGYSRTTAKAFADNILKSIKDIANSAAGKMGQIADVTAQVISKVAGNVSDLADKAADSASNMADKTSDVADKTADMAGKAADKASDIADKTADKASDIADKTADKASDIADKTADKASDMADKASDVAEKAADGANKMADEGKKKINDKMDQ